MNLSALRNRQQFPGGLRRGCLSATLLRRVLAPLAVHLQHIDRAVAVPCGGNRARTRSRKTIMVDVTTAVSGSVDATVDPPIRIS